MTYERLISLLGLLLNSALYIALVFVGGVLAGNPLVWKLAIATAGICYICYVLQAVNAKAWASGFVTLLSVITGVGAGLCLLFGIGK